METFSALLAICAGNSTDPGEFPTQRPVTRSFDVYFDLRPNKRLSKQSWGWWFETPSHPFWRHRNGISLWKHGNMKKHLHFESFIVIKIRRQHKMFIIENNELFIPHRQYFSCRWCGDERNQVNSSHAIVLVFMDSPTLRTKRFNPQGKKLNCRNKLKKTIELTCQAIFPWQS